MPTAPLDRDTVETVPEQRDRRSSRAGRRVAAAVFTTLITVPGALYLAGGRAAPIDNRTPTSPPPVDRLVALDDGALGQLEDHLAESVPGRELAVRVNAWTELHVLGRSPNPDVVLGDDGWLYLRSTIEVPCELAEAVPEVERQMTRAARLVESTGRRWVTAVAPDKAALYPEHVGDDVDAACFERFTDAIVDELEASPPPGYVPTWDALRADRDAAEAPTYHVHDTHWTDAGSWPFARTLVAALDAELLDDVTVTPVTGLVRTGDLTKLYGLPSDRDAPGVIVERPGVTSHVAPASTLDAVPDDVHPDYGQLQTTTGEGVAMVEGATVLWHDSFGEIALPHLEPFFRQLVGVRRRPIARPWVSEVIAASDTVMYETVQRVLVPRWTEGHIVGQLAWALRDELPTTRAEPDPEGWIAVDPDRAPIVAIPVEALPEARRGTPLRLEVRGGDGGLLVEQRDFDVDTPRIFDLSAVPDAAYVRVVQRDRSGVDVSHVLQIADVAGR